MRNNEIKTGKIVIYKFKEGPKLKVRMEDETVIITKVLDYKLIKPLIWWE